MRQKRIKLRFKQRRAPEGSCFVLMPFGLPFDRYYERIFVPAIKALDLKPVRGDKEFFLPTPIISDIWKSIRSAKILLADLTGRNANVFYELGLAHAIGKPVILVANTIDDVPFDLRHLRILIYDKNVDNWGAKLRGEIRQALLESLVNFSTAVPLIFLKGKRRKKPLKKELKKNFSNLLVHLRSNETLSPEHHAQLRLLLLDARSRNTPDAWHDPADLRERFRGV